MRVKLVVVDPQKAHVARVHSYRLHPAVQKRVAAQPHPEAGSIHAEMNDACPEGRPNCRNCGDPDYAQQCKQQGHCPDCGTRHGVAPDSVLARNGLAIET